MANCCGELLFSVGFRRDYSGGAALVQFCTQPIDIKSLIAQQSLETNTLDQGLNAEQVMALTGQQYETNQAAQSIHQSDDLGGQASSRAPDGLILSPPLAPLAFW